MGEMKQEEDGRSAVSAAVITFDLDTRRIDRVRSRESSRFRGIREILFSLLSA